MNTRTRDLVCGAFFLLVGLFMYMGARNIPGIIENEVGSAFAPKLVGLTLMCLSCVLLAATATKKGAEKVKSNGDLRGGLMTIALLAAYVLLFDKLGFVISTCLYLFAQITVLSDYRNRNLKLFACVSLGASIAVYLLFVKALGLILPAGLLGLLPI